MFDYKPENQTATHCTGQKSSPEDIINKWLLNIIEQPEQSRRERKAEKQVSGASGTTTN
jgi:hypothetical protein